MTADFGIPEGKVIRSEKGGTDVLKGLLVDLKRYAFTGYLSTSSTRLGQESSGIVGIKEGSPILSVHSVGDDLLHGRPALKRVWEDSYTTTSTIEIHAQVTEAELLEALGPEARIEGGARERAKEARKREPFRRKIAAWRSKGYDVSTLEKVMEKDFKNAGEAFERFAENVKKLEVLADILDSLDTEGFEGRVQRIREMFSTPSMALAVEAEIEGLREEIEASREAAETALAGLEGSSEEGLESVPTRLDEPAAASQALAMAVTEADLEEQQAVNDETHLIKSFTFDRFVIGASNRFAQAACFAVARAPYTTYNPLFVTSGTGLGKTHLLNAIGNYVTEHDGEAKVIYLPTERFTNEFRRTLGEGNLHTFRDKYRSVDIFLLDDAQFLAGREDVQEELFHTFEALYNAKKQIVLTSDRPPKEIPALEERLVSRFESGLVADIQVPEPETRLAILRARVKRDGLDVPDDVLEFISAAVTDNIRELTGALNRVVAFSSLMNTPVSVSIAKEVLKDMVGEAPARTTARLEEYEGKLVMGRAYLVEEERPSQSLRLFARQSHGLGGLIITRMNPKRVRERYDLRHSKILWLTDRESQTEETIPPSLERVMFTIEEFISTVREGTILIDGVEYLVSNNTFEAVLKFIRQLVDEVSESDFVLLISLAPKTLQEREVKTIEREMEALHFV